MLLLLNLLRCKYPFIHQDFFTKTDMKNLEARLDEIQKALEDIQSRLKVLEVIVKGDGMNESMSHRIRSLEATSIQQSADIKSLKEGLEEMNEALDQSLMKIQKISEQLNHLTGKMTMIVVIISVFLSVLVGVLQRVFFP